MRTTEEIVIGKEGKAVYKKTAIKTTKDGKRKQKLIENREISAMNLFVPKEKDEFILPTGTKFFKNQGDTTVLVIEHSPQVRNTFWGEYFMENERNYVLSQNRSMKGKKIKANFQLAFPYILYFCVIRKRKENSLRLYYRTEPLRSLKDFLFLPNLPNIESGGGSVCIGDDSIVDNSQTISRIVDQVITNFWSSKFNTDLCRNYYDYRKDYKEFQDLWKWEQESRKNPIFPLRTCWKGLLYSVEDVLNSLLRDYEDRCHQIPTKKEEIFSFLSRKILQAPNTAKGQLVEEKGETKLKIGDALQCIRYTSTFTKDQIYIIEEFSKERCSCSANRSCPKVKLSTVDGFRCIFGGNSLISYLRKIDT